MSSEDTSKLPKSSSISDFVHIAFEYALSGSLILVALFVGFFGHKHKRMLMSAITFEGSLLFMFPLLDLVKQLVHHFKHGATTVGSEPLSSISPWVILVPVTIALALAVLVWMKESWRQKVAIVFGASALPYLLVLPLETWFEKKKTEPHKIYYEKVSHYVLVYGVLGLSVVSMGIFWYLHKKFEKPVCIWITALSAGILLLFGINGLYKTITGQELKEASLKWPLIMVGLAAVFIGVSFYVQWVRRMKPGFDIPV